MVDIHADSSLASLQDIAQDFQTTASTTNFSVGLYMLSLAIFPLFVSPSILSPGLAKLR